VIRIICFVTVATPKRIAGGDASVLAVLGITPAGTSRDKEAPMPTVQTLAELVASAAPQKLILIVAASSSISVVMHIETRSDAQRRELG